MFAGLISRCIICWLCIYWRIFKSCCMIIFASSSANPFLNLGARVVPSMYSNTRYTESGLSYTAISFTILGWFKRRMISISFFSYPSKVHFVRSFYLDMVLIATNYYDSMCIDLRTVEKPPFPISSPNSYSLCISCNVHIFDNSYHHLSLLPFYFHSSCTELFLFETSIPRYHLLHF